MDATEGQPDALPRETGHDIEAADLDDLDDVDDIDDLADVTALSTDESAQRDDLPVRPENS